MLRKIRIILAALMLIGITLLFVGIGHQWWGWMAKLQFLPSCLALNVGVIVGITLITLVLGRVYCSVICPMGVFQDLVLWLRRRIGPKKKFAFNPERKWVRYIVLALFVAAIVAGIQVFIALLAPYSAYGRIVRSIAGIGSGSTAWVVTAVAGVTLVAIFLCAWCWGRAYCNTVCPVGTVLSLFSRFAMFRVTIDPDKCRHCHGCEKECKASCIDSASQTIDYSRCVSCFDCIKDCKFGAINYTCTWGGKKAAATEAAAPAKEGADAGRRAFVAGSAFLLGAAALNAQNQGGLAVVLPKQDPGRSERLVPFGSGSVAGFYAHCTACQLCISACPNHVLRPSTDLGHLMQPQMGYEDGYCRPECTACSQVCPAGAIVPVKREEKFGIKIGTAVVDAGLCIGCGNCTRHCPTGAVTMIEKDGKAIPVVAEAQCIGCGACEYLCPTRPISAIHVNGISVHQKH
ncbi:MAG: 4Fe-4S dicluster domain-containing protein [Bacteroidales bacterium]|nr:4Fe-4S dicluster domain-containing protein [Bacteroidales bacterium]